MEGYDNFGLWLSDESQYKVGGKSKHGTLIKPNIDVVTTTNGFDIVYTFKNNKKDTTSIGEFYLGNFNLNETIYYRNTRYTFQEDTIVAKKNIQYASDARIYPDPSSYSPITVIRDNNYIVGISFIYPVMDYKHSINQMFFGMFTDNKRIGWNMNVQINKNINGQQYFESGELSPGEQRIYKISIRVKKVVNAKNDWKEVIKPYKEYFDKEFGKVKYIKDDRPVLGYHGASEYFFSETNKYGFPYDKNDNYLASHPRRPDHYGFKPTAQYIKKLSISKHAARVMIWVPSGLYRTHQNLNYPYQFASQLEVISKSKSQLSRSKKICDAILNYKSLSKEMSELGMWWGHAGGISYRWDDAILPFNTRSQKDWSYAYKEIDMAKSLGVTCLGLDAFIEMPGWDQYLWLNTMRTRTNGSIKFIVEIYSFDIIHTLAGFMYADWNCKGYHELANYLVPGNEMWFLIQRDSPKDLEAYTKKVVSLGYVPCIIAHMNDKVNFNLK